MNTDNHGEENSPFRRRRLPSLNALRCFEAAARLENFSRAAEALCLTHGAISRAVRTLEEELGCALFERRGQRVFLSEAGRRLLAGTGPALDLIERTGETLRAEASPTALVLSCEPTLLMRWLIPRIAGFMQEQPRLSIQLVAGGGPFAFGRGIDLAIRRNDFPGRPAAMLTGCSTSRSARSAGRAASNGISTSMQARPGFAPSHRACTRRPARKPGTPGPVSPDRRRRRPKGSASSTST